MQEHTDITQDHYFGALEKYVRIPRNNPEKFTSKV